jgi:DNA polymerase-3 subunit delta
MLGSALRRLQNEFVAKHGDFAVEKIDVNEWEVSRILDVFSALPFLTRRRLVIVDGLAQNKSAAEAIEKILDAASDETDVVVVEQKIDKRSILYKTLKKRTAFTEFLEIDQRDAPKWVADEVKKRGGTVTQGDAYFLVERVGASQELLSHEIDKLLLFNKDVTRNTILMLTEQTMQSSIFDLIEAAFRGDSAYAEKLYDEQRAQNVEPLAIEALFVWQLHVLLLVKAAEGKTPEKVAADAGISPFVAKKSAALARTRTIQELKDYVRRLAELECALKSVAVDADEAIKNYITHLSAA